MNNLGHDTALTLGGLRILSVGGVGLLKVIAGSERGKQVLAFNFIADTALIPHGLRCDGSFNPQLGHTPGVAASAHAAAVAEEEQQGEQDQRPPGKSTQQHQQEHIVLHLAHRHRHVLGERDNGSGPRH